MRTSRRNKWFMLPDTTFFFSLFIPLHRSHPHDLICGFIANEKCMRTWSLNAFFRSATRDRKMLEKFGEERTTKNEKKLKNYSNCVPSFRRFNGTAIIIKGREERIAYIKMRFVHYNRLLRRWKKSLKSLQHAEQWLRVNNMFKYCSHKTFMLCSLFTAKPPWWS